MEAFNSTDFNKIAIKYSTAVVVGTAKSKAKIVAKATLADAFLKGKPGDIASIMIAIASMEEKVADKADMYIEALKIGKANYALFLAVVQVVTQEGEKLDVEDRDELYGIISEDVEEFEDILEIAQSVEYTHEKRCDCKNPAKPAVKDMYNKWIKVDSENIDMLLYNNITHNLQVNLKSGKVCMYDNVNEWTFEQLMGADSKEIYIDLFIKQNFKCREF